MKFKNDIEAQAGFKDAGGDLGVAGQLLSSTGTETNWIDQSTIASGSAEVVEVPVKNLQGSALTKGDPVYISGSVGASGILEVQLADAGNAAKMPAVGLLKQDLAANAQGFAVVTGKLRNLITSPIDGVTPNPNTVVYVKSGGSTGAALTTVKPGGSTNLIQNMGKVGRVSTSSDGTLVVSSILRSNDVPNLPLGRLFVGTSANTSLTSDVVYIDDANDRVGIGTTSPGARLEVKSAAPNTFFANFISSTGSGSAKIYENSNSHPLLYMADATGTTTIVLNSSGVSYLTSGNIIIGGTADNGNLLQVQGTGYFDDNVGIGTSSPGVSLQVQSNTNQAKRTLRLAYDSSYYFDIAQLGAGGVHYNAIQATSGGHKFQIDGSEKMRISYSGNVGIGTTSPQSQLQINGGNGLTVTANDTAYSAGYFGRMQSDYGTNALRLVSRAGDVFRATNYGQDVAILTGSVNTGTSERMRIDSAGNVGIGTTSPGAKLHVTGDNVNASEATVRIGGVPSFGNGVSRLELVENMSANVMNYGFSLTADGDSTNNLLIRNHSNSTVGNVAIAVDRDTSNVGIGTTSPGYKLSVNSSTLNEIANFESTDVGGFVSIKDNVDTSYFGSYNGKTFIGPAGGSSTTNLNIDNSNGNVGIGTTSPTNKLDIRQSTSGGSDVLGTGAITIGSDNPYWTFRGTATSLQDLAFDRSYAGTWYESMRIQRSTGNVGIGTTSPSTTLHVNGFARLNGGLQLNTANAQIYQIQNSDLRFGTNNTERMRIDSLGNVGIGTTSPGRQLELRGQGVIKLTATSVSGRTSPSATLDINSQRGTATNLSSSKTAAGFDLNSNTAGGTNSLTIGETDQTSYFLQHANSAGTTAYNLALNPYGGNVGIGTTSPTWSI
jgi:hypothetical protein